MIVLPQDGQALPPLRGEADYRTLGLSGQSAGAVYHLMTAMIVPRPIALVTTLGETGVLNVAPFSFFNGVCSDPPILSLAIIRHPVSAERPDEAARLKDTARNIRRSGQFVVNIAAVDLAAAVETAGKPWPPETSEAELLGLGTLASHQIDVPRLAQCPIQLECRLERIVEVGEGPTDLVLGRIVEAHAALDVFNDKGRLDVDRIRPLSRLSAGSYAGLLESFRFDK
jgi:flavin reductase (DIM6/NTAB) family NADH-FMN oxidoreductase RutF